MYRRILLIVAIVVCLVLGVYFKHFHRLPTEDILAANLARLDAVADDYDDDAVADSAARRSQRDWDQWIKRNRFVSIGKLFDKCGEMRQFIVGLHASAFNPPHRPCCLDGAVVERRTSDRKVAGSTPGRGAIESTRSTQPSISPG